MKGFYSYEDNILDLTTKFGIHFYLKLRGHIVVVLGNSGTGKTLLTNALITAKKVSEIENDFDCSNIYVFDENDSIDTLRALNHNLVVIDRYDKIETEGLSDYISNDNDNMYLLFSRGIKYIALSPNYFGEFIRNSKEVTLNFKYSVDGWY